VAQRDAGDHGGTAAARCDRALLAVFRGPSDNAPPAELARRLHDAYPFPERAA
jgi:hypothetical protein